MKPPPIINPPPAAPNPVDPVVQGFILGGVWIVVAILSEWLTQPAVPFYQIFQLIPVAIGLGVGSGVLSARFKWGIAVRIVLAFFFIYEVGANHLSPLPLFLFLGVCYLSKAGVVLADRNN